MLPRNRLARQQLTKLKVYAGPDHPHAAQQPKPMEIDEMNDDETTDFRDARTEEPQGRGPTTAGPVAEEDSSSSQAAGEEPTSTPPADEASEAPGAGAARRRSLLSPRS